MKNLRKMPTAVLLAMLLAFCMVVAAAGYDSVRGDVNGDGVCDIADALLVLHAVLDGETLPGGDVNGDGRLGLADVILTLKLTALPPEPTRYTVTFTDAGGAELKRETVTCGADATPPLAPYREGYRFAGWSGTYTAVTADTVVTAEYVPFYLIQFVDSDGSLLNLQVLDAGETVTAPEEMPVRRNCRFNGWDNMPDTATEDATVTAQYVRQYTVTFRDFDGTVLKTETVDAGDAATPPEALVREGYTFFGWDTDAYANVEADVTVYATYQFVYHTVTFCMPDGSVIAAEKVEHGYAASAPTPEPYLFTWDAYDDGTFDIAVQEFTGWDTAFDKVTKSLEVTAQYASAADFDRPVLVMRFANGRNSRTAQIAMKVSNKKCRVYALDFSIDSRGLPGSISKAEANTETPLIRQGKCKVSGESGGQILSFTAASINGLSIENSTLLFNKLVLATDNKKADENIFRIGADCVMVVDEGDGTPLRKVTPVVVYMQESGGNNK